MRSSIRRCDLMMASADFFHAKGVGDLFQARMNAFRCPRNMRLDPKSLPERMTRPVFSEEKAVPTAAWAIEMMKKATMAA
jgi:hypothetical protein